LERARALLEAIVMKTRMLMVLAFVAGALLSAPAAAEDFKAPEGKVALHYFRSGGDYTGWGLHSWESFQKKEDAGDEWAKKELSDRPLKGVAWNKPLPQTGKDDFGVYWVMDAKDFENGRVNYIIHKGDVKDQCNKDMFWLVKDSRDAYVNAGDCKVYTSKEDALKARK
jgi:hypothetical protein